MNFSIMCIQPLFIYLLFLFRNMDSQFTRYVYLMFKFLKIAVGNLKLIWKAVFQFNNFKILNLEITFNIFKFLNF